MGFTALGSLIGGAVLCAIPGGAFIGGPMIATAGGTLLGATGGAAVAAGVVAATEKKKTPKRSPSTVDKAKAAEKKQRVDRDFEDLKALREHEACVRVLMAFASGATKGDTGRVEGFVLGLRGGRGVSPKLRRELSRLKATPPSFMACMRRLGKLSQVEGLRADVLTVLKASGNREWLGWYAAEAA
jgi:hypothetical protein